MGNPQTVQVLVDLVHQKQPNFIFLIETMVSRESMEWVKHKLGFQGLFSINSNCNGGGTTFLWTEKNRAQLLSFSNNHNDIRVQFPNTPYWRLTGFYGHADRNRRRESWDLLRYLSHQSQLPWCCIGDYNDLLLSCEKKGNNSHPIWLLKGFNQAVQESGLHDIGVEGYPFIWERRRGFPDWIEERLDRALATMG